MISTWRDSLIGLLWLLAIIFLAYVPTQDEFLSIFLGFVVSFACYLLLIRPASKVPFDFLVIIAIVGRIALIPALPNLSDDFCRFIWDGRLWHLGINPFSNLPIDLIGEADILTDDLLNNLNSPRYYSIYPPLPQFIFWIATFIPSSDYFLESGIMKSIHVLFELGTIRLLWILIKKYNFNARYWLWYALNPLVIIEVINNLHHEGIMLFFILLTIFFLKKRWVSIAGVCLGLSIATKLLPLLFVPLLFFKLKGTDRWQFCIYLAGTVLLLFTPIFWNSQLLENIGSSADLYIRSFEYNASLYYLLRSWGNIIYGFNTIHIVGPMLKFVTTIGVLFYSYKNRSASNILPVDFTWIFFIFLILSTTVHPWYVVLLIGFAPLTQFKWPLVWSFLISMTYINYSYNPYQENMWVVGMEYVIIGLLLLTHWRGHQINFDWRNALR